METKTKQNDASLIYQDADGVFYVDLAVSPRLDYDNTEEEFHWRVQREDDFEELEERGWAVNKREPECHEIPELEFYDSPFGSLVVAETVGPMKITKVDRKELKAYIRSTRESSRCRPVHF